MDKPPLAAHFPRKKSGEKHMSKGMPKGIPENLSKKNPWPMWMISIPFVSQLDPRNVDI